MESLALEWRNALANLRFAANPVSECALASMIVRYPQHHPFHAQWFSQTAQGRARVGEERITLLLNPQKDLIDVFMRPATRRAATWESERRILDEIPAARYRHDTELVWGTPPADLGRTDEQVKAALLSILDDFWEACFASWWPRFKQVLDADVTHRAQMLAAQGPQATLAEVQPALLVRGNDIVLPVRRFDPGPVYSADTSSGFTMLPTLVKWGTNVPNSAEADAVVSYRARGRGRLYERQADTVPALVGILGRARTELLLGLDEPASSTAIALYSGVTTGAVNQHLRTLARAHLLQSSRFGRYVLYERTALGEALIAENS